MIIQRFNPGIDFSRYNVTSPSDSDDKSRPPHSKSKHNYL